MKVTFVTTVFNDGNLLMNAVRSVLRQTCEDFQYIIVDDGSSAETARLLDRIDDPRVQIVRQANDGLSGARNKALQMVDGDYVCFLDADDTRPNWFLRAVLDLVERTDPDVVFCPGVLSEIRGDLSGFYDAPKFAALRDVMDGESIDLSDADEVVPALLQLIEPQSANKVVRTELLTSDHIRFPDTHFFEDIYFHTRVICASRRIAMLDSPGFAYFRRYGRSQITSTVSDRRMDIIAVTKLTLEMLRQSRRFHDPLYRASVVTSCFRLVRWCESAVSHHYKWPFRVAVQALVRLADPQLFHFPPEVPDHLSEIQDIRPYIEGYVRS